MDFGWALAALRNGESVKRGAWDELGNHFPYEYASLALAVPADGYEEQLIVTRHDGRLTIFSTSHYSLLAHDWVLA